MPWLLCMNVYLIIRVIGVWFLFFNCILLIFSQKTSLMEQVAHQTIILQFILQLGIQMKTDPRDCYMAFFKRFETMQAEYIESFNDELNAFKGRVKGKKCFGSTHCYCFMIA